jgi:shikimate kinase
VTPSRNPLIVLIGFRGSGKTTVAELLAPQLGWDWIDADQALEALHRRTVKQIFEDEGEAGFRDKEAALFDELSRRTRHVVAAGGGVVLRSANRQSLRRAGLVVWLNADVDTLWQRLQEDARQHRPVLTVGGRPEVEELLRIRAPLYHACADVVVETAARAPADVAAAILAHWRGL